MIYSVIQLRLTVYARINIPTQLKVYQVLREIIHFIEKKIFPDITCDQRKYEIDLSQSNRKGLT